MVDSRNPGALMWMLLVIPFKAPCWPHCPSPCHSTIGLRSTLRLVALLYTSYSILSSFLYLRASPKCGLLWLFFRAGIQTLLTVAVLAEACQIPELSDLRAYHDLLIQSFVIEFLVLLSTREFLHFCLCTPGPILARFTFLWSAWHLVKGTYEPALLKAHQTYGPVVRIAPYTYSIVKDHLEPEVQSKLDTCDFSSPHIGLIHIFNHYSMSEQVLSQASANEPAIDACIDSLLENLAKSMDKEGVQTSRLLTCLGWDVMSAITIGERFEFIDSPDASILADILAKSRVESAWYGSFLRFHPWIAEISSWFVPQTSITDWLSLFKNAMIRLHMSDDKECNVETATKAMQDRLNDKSEFLHTRFGVHCGPPEYHYWSVLSFLIGTADPIAAYLQTIMAYLACHPDAQIQVREEAQSNLKEDGLSLQNLLDLGSSLPYLNAVLRESDRLAATEGVILNQSVEEAVEIQGCHIPPGSTIRLTRGGGGRDRSLFGDDVDRWDPSRWLNKEIAFDSTTPSYSNPTSRAIVAKIVLRLVQQFQFTLDMTSYTPTIVFLSAKELEQICLFVKSASLSQKLSALNNPHGATLMTISPNPTERLLSMFEGPAKEKLSDYIKDPTQSSTFSLIQSIPLDRNQRREIHNLIRQLSKGKLDSGLDHKTSRINVYLRGTGSAYHKQENQRPRFPQNNAPRTTTPRNVAPRNVAPRAAFATRSAAPRAAPLVTLTAEQQQKHDAWIKAAAEQTVLNQAARAEAMAAAPITEFKEMDWAINETFKCTVKPKEEESPEVIAECAERKKKAVPPHKRHAAANKE